MKPKIKFFVPTILGALALMVSANPFDLMVHGAMPANSTGRPGNVTQLNKPNLVSTALEVTQAVQDLSNSVPLISGKNTYARFHVQAQGSSDVPDVTAFLVGTRYSPGPPTFLGALSPLNPSSRITVKLSPDRAEINDSFLFQLPDSWRYGIVQLVAVVDYDHSVSESVETDNGYVTWASFSSVPPLRVRLYHLRYPSGDTTAGPTRDDVNLLTSWLRRAYPISRLDVAERGVNLSRIPNDCGEANNILWMMWGTDYILNNMPGFGFLHPRTRFYGMVQDTGGFMRGCASDTPSLVASGPSGSDTGGWDNDGSYNDWYGSHELAHCFGRCHAEFCGALGGCNDQIYPYPNGSISSADGAFYGFDIGLEQVYPPDPWTDVMAYCDYQWISDFTYKGIHSQLISEEESSAEGSTLGAVTTQPQDLIVIEGRMNVDQPSATLGNIYVLSGRRQPPPPKPGHFSLRFFDRSGGLLAEFPFTPKLDTDESNLLPPGKSPTVQPQPSGRKATIFEIVPFDERTARVAVWHDGVELASRRRSANPPRVRLLSPNGGEALTDRVNVTWVMSDSDGDRLTATLLYSPDAGKSWSAVATRIEASSHLVTLTELPGGGQALFRVLVSDGVNTAEDTSDNTFRVPNRRPKVQILSPAGGKVFSRGRPLMFEADGQDLEDGQLPNETFSWNSSLQGPLGKGRNLELASLMVGKHTIKVVGADKNGNVGSDSIVIEIR